MGEQLFGLAGAVFFCWIIARSVVNGIQRGDMRWEESEYEERPVDRRKSPQYRVVKARRYR
ncbi:MAG: hypothetical protein K6T81_18365 [Alicyclobacillus macrosporangiidus]|uniref:hypothetical protein n=1 Tax=Alicyclobacillus macrosporangiidus TaxID=392015 RepID=UPI0026EE1B48|nr:hypothetical protein [Alicyclobacillus macrosporangiidus]MCL6600673.1 hypothetical protein [Alicyclobacillus macrosporangiidus]